MTRLNWSSVTTRDRGAETYRAEQLFQLYKKRRSEALGWDDGERLEAAIVAGWREVVSKCLYSSFRSGNGKLNVGAFEEKVKSHSYLMRLGRLARDAALVVTHNFDDALETTIDLDPSISAPAGRRYHSFWRPEPFLRPGMVNIYHPNGYIPAHRELRGSENLILTEAGFADHLANTNTEEAHFLLRHLADKTCIIIGHSLSDGTLKNALRQHANQRSGHVNYYIHYNKNGEASLDSDQRDAIRNANFETYGLITIFANSSEIAQILEYVSMEEDELEGVLALDSIPAKYVYYIVGTVSAGKSTTLRHLRDLATIEEWPARMPAVMNRPSVGLKSTEEEKIDQHLEEAIWRKNCEIRDIKVGMVAVDRAPLDFIAFPSKSRETAGVTARKRASSVLGRLGDNDLRDLCVGQVIVLEANSAALLYRQLQRGSSRATPADAANGSAERYLKKQQSLIAKIYKRPIQEGSTVRTDRVPMAVSLKAVARIIHLENYTPFDFLRRLHAIQKEK